ncbi:NAD(P)-dependent alcohol dehydrogenase [Flavobacterium sp. JP2137]|uniref:NAD(P)-dependent alcohol dehydrogenase n=1 Tax=Flavobacterium sp. JP2137 TaxID=3414510 RepID=UPI003D2FEDB1
MEKRTITAAVVREKGGLFQLEEVQLEAPRATEVLVKMVATGTCHTDMVARDAIMGPEFPSILGHEGSGIVEAVGSGVTKVKKGDHVVLTFGYCGNCINCKKGLPAYCEEFMALNFQGCRLDGSHSHSKGAETINGHFFSQSSFATYSLATENNVVKVPKEVDLELLGPLGCGIQTGAGAIINALRVNPGSAIAISGIGAVGLAALLAAKASGATTIVAIDINEERLKFSKELGATHTINTKNSDLAQELLKIETKGFHFAFDTTGRNEVINGLLQSLYPHGVCGLVGVATKPLQIDMNYFVGKGLQIKGIVEGDSVPDEFILQLIQLYQQGLFPFDQLIKKYPFSEINQAIADSESGKTIKPVIQINNY